MSSRRNRRARPAPQVPRWRTRAGRWSALIAVVAGAALWIVAGRPGIGDRARRTPRPAAPGAEYIGSGTCRSCHTSEYESWTASHHSQAMQVAESGRVRGDFANAEVTYAGVTSTFFRRSGGFWVRTDGADGRLQDFQVKYTFGVSPLQQYLIEAPDGRVQALSIAWDTRGKEQGGQRWFHLYPKERITHTDELHWTGRHQNWNFMCADCHSTNVRKGYDAAQDRFQTTWSEINVACESCHGPGSRHETWARTPEWRSDPLSRSAHDNGLTVHFTERKQVSWVVESSHVRCETKRAAHHDYRNQRVRPMPLATRPDLRAVCSRRTARGPLRSCADDSRLVPSGRPAARRGVHVRLVRAEPHGARRRDVL